MKGLTRVNSNWVSLVFILISIVFVNPAFAHHAGHKHDKKRLELHFDDWHLKGENSIRLKRELRHQYPHVELRDYELKKVAIFAQTKRGRGTARLRVGDFYSDKKTVGRHYDRVKFHNPHPEIQGPWQLRLKGNFRVNRVVVVLVPHYQNHFETVVDYKSHKYGHSDKTLPINRKIKNVQFLGKKRKTQIHNVYVEFGNGDVLRLRDLEGKLSSGQCKEAVLGRYRYVKYIHFDYSPKRFGKRSRFQVKV